MNARRSGRRGARRHTMLRTWLIAAALTAFAQVATGAAQKDGAGAIQGVVTGVDDAPLSNATIRVESEGLVATTTTGANGSFLIAGLPPDTYSVHVLGQSGLILAETKVQLASAAMAVVTIGAAGIPPWRPAAAATDRSRFQIGRVGVTPSVRLVSAGFDSNVMNEEQARGDATLTLTPEAIVGGSSDRFRATGLVRGDYAHFQRLSAERAGNVTAEGRVDFTPLQFNRWVEGVTPWVEVGLRSGRWRAGHEIDMRAARHSTNFRLGAERTLADTIVALAVERRSEGFGPDQLFLDSDLRHQLNRHSVAVALQARRTLSDGLTGVVEVERRRDRFDYASERNANGTLFQGGLDFDRPERIGGRLRIGYRTLDGIGGAVPAYHGLLASAEGGVILRPRTRLEFRAEHGLTYSAEALYPYFAGTGATAFVTQRLADRWELKGGFGTERLDYRATPGVDAAPRLDWYRLAGGGLGYYLSPDMRIGIDVAREQRRASDDRHSFVGYRFGTSVTIGVLPLPLRAEPARP